jgi:virginiamycin A acetyltransferase
MGGTGTYPFGVFDPSSFETCRSGFTGLPDTVIGPDCRIGHGALILPGARFGAGVIVGAGAVVRGDVPDHAIVAGNPARVVRLRFASDEIAALLRIAWRSWTPERIRACLPLVTGVTRPCCLWPSKAADGAHRRSGGAAGFHP